VRLLVGKRRLQELCRKFAYSNLPRKYPSCNNSPGLCAIGCVRLLSEGMLAGLCDMIRDPFERANICCNCANVVFPLCIDLLQELLASLEDAFSLASPDR
jgi:hypothetical protein